MDAGRVSRQVVAELVDAEYVKYKKLQQQIEASTIELKEIEERVKHLEGRGEEENE